MKRSSALLLWACWVSGTALQAQKSGAEAGPESLLQVRRIYVAQLAGGPQADALRELIIASLDSTKLFVLTDNPERADAILKGAADDRTFTDTFDSDESVASNRNAGKSGSGSYRSGASGLVLGMSAGGNEAHHIKERKHEAYAAVRLCNHDGDVLWSTTQESLGAKFRSASADVAAKIARQIALDMERERHPAVTSSAPGP
jgi:hypothetical protein